MHIPHVPCNGEGPRCFLRKLLSTAPGKAKSTALPARVLCSTSWRLKIPWHCQGAQGSQQRER